MNAEVEELAEALRSAVAEAMNEKHPDPFAAVATLLTAAGYAKAPF